MSLGLPRWVRCVCLLAPVLIASGCAGVATQGKNQGLLETDQLADEAYRDGRFAEATEYYEELARALPNEPHYWYRLGNAYVRTERPQEAVFAYQQSLAVDAHNARAWHNLGIILLRQAQESFVLGMRASDPGEPEHARNERMLNMLKGVTGETVPEDADADTPLPDSVQVEGVEEHHGD